MVLAGAPSYLRVLLPYCMTAGTACFIHVMNNISLAGLVPYTNVKQPSSWVIGYFNISNNLVITGKDMRQWVSGDSTSQASARPGERTLIHVGHTSLCIRKPRSDLQHGKLDEPESPNQSNHWLLMMQKGQCRAGLGYLNVRHINITTCCVATHYSVLFLPHSILNCCFHTSTYE
jgi:hypothetical protein